MPHHNNSGTIPKTILKGKTRTTKIQVLHFFLKKKKKNEIK